MGPWRFLHGEPARGQEPPPACAISAHARDVDKRRAIEAGFDFFVAKPVTEEQLVEAALELRAIGSAAREA